MIFADKLPLTGIRHTADGYAVAEVPVARTGIQDYAGYEVGRPDMQRVSVYRPPETVFADEYLASMAHKPITDDHPREAVTADNWDGLAKGWTGETIRKDEAAGLVYVPMMLADGATISKLEDGKREVSCGYSCELVWEDGETPEGVRYQAKQINARINHIAVVDKGRAGSQCRIGDNWAEFNESKEPLVALKTITYDGLPLEVTDAAEAVIAKMTAARDSLADELKAETKALADATAAHDKAMAAKDAEIDKLKEAQLSQDAIDALADAKAEVVSQAKAILGDTELDTAGKTVASIRRETVAQKLGDAAVADKSDDYIEARFDTLKPEVKDEFRQTVESGVTTGDADKAVADARKAYINSLTNPFAKQDA